jgi:hypothetical protein
MNTKNVKAINSKHQRNVTAFISWNEKYDLLIDGGKDETKASEKAYSKALDLWDALPKREQKNIEKHIDNVKGSY